MNLVITMGSIERIGELKKAKSGNNFVNVSVWTRDIGIQKENRNILVNFQAFDEAAYEILEYKNNFTPQETFLMIGYVNISNTFKGAVVQKTIKIENEDQIDDFFKNEFWKIL